VTKEAKILLATGGAAFVVFCVFLVMVAKVRKRDRTDECAVNLRHIHMAMAMPDHPRWDEMPSGRAFWMRYQDWPAHGTFKLHMSDVVCPVKGGKPGEEIDYRGPSKSYRTLEPTDALASDRSGNHGAGPLNVLLKNGSLFPVEESTDGWRKAQSTTSD